MKKYKDKDWLEKMYQNHSCSELGRMIGCSQTTISRYILKYGIVKHISEPLYKNKEWLQNAITQYTVKEISEILQCGEMTIYRWIKKFKINKNFPIYKNKEYLQNELKTKTITQIANENNISITTVSRLIKKFNINSKDKPYKDQIWLKEQLDECSGSITEMAKRTGYKRDTLYEWCLKFGFSAKERKRIYNFDEKYFQNIDNEHKAYWLGFLMADGFVDMNCRSFGISLQRQDKYLIENFIKDLNYPGKIYDTQHIVKETRNISYTSGVTICSSEMCKNLIYHGIVPNKSGKEIIPNTVSDELIIHFIRGFLDGDGSIGIKRLISFCSMSLNILYSIKYFFENILNIKEYSFKEKIGSSQRKTLYYYCIFGKSAEIVANYLYKDATIYLERKYNRYKNWKNSPAK